MIETIEVVVEMESIEADVVVVTENIEADVVVVTESIEADEVAVMESIEAEEAVAVEEVDVDPTSTKEKEKMEIILKIKRDQEMKVITKLADMIKIITIMIEKAELEEGIYI